MPMASLRALRWTSLVETGLFLVAATVVNFLVDPDHLGFGNVEPHPYWAIVLLISLRYGLRENLACATLVGVVHVAFTVGTAAEYSFSAIHIFADFRNPILFVLVAGVISAFTQQLLERNAEMRRELAVSEGEIGDLQESNQARTVALRELEARIASEFTSILDLFGEVSQTRRMSVEQTQARLLEVLSRYVSAEAASFYDVEGDRLCRRFALGDRPVGETVRRRDDIVLDEALRSTQIAHLGHFSGAEDYGRYEGSLLAGTLRSGDFRVLGVVAVEAMPFVDYNPHTFKLFATIVDWWSTVLEEQLRLEELRQKSVFDDELGLYNHPYFADRVRQEFERAKRFSLPMCLALLRIEDYGKIAAGMQGRLKTAIAGILREGISELEMAARYHREDVIAVSFPIAMARDAEARLRAAAESVERFHFTPYGEGDDRVLQLSWCVAEYEIGMESADELVARAEALLQDVGADA